MAKPCLEQISTPVFNSNSMSRQHLSALEKGLANLETGEKVHMGAKLDCSLISSICSPGWIRTVEVEMTSIPAKNRGLKILSVLVPIVTCLALAEQRTV